MKDKIDKRILMQTCVLVILVGITFVFSSARVFKQVQAQAQGREPILEPIIGLVRQIIAESDDLTVQKVWYDLETKYGVVSLQTDQDLSGLVNQLVQVTRTKYGDVVSLRKSQQQQSEFASGDLNIPPPTVGFRKTLVIMVRLQDQTPSQITEAQIRDAVFTGDYSANAFLRQASGYKFGLTGRFRSDGDIQNWVTIPFSVTENCSQQLFNAWTTAADDAANSNGFSKTEYTLRMYMFPPIPGCVYGAVGSLGQLGNSTLVGQSWYQLPSDPNFLSQRVPAVYHEVGHNIGIALHSGSQVSETDPGTDAGDRGDFMGNAKVFPHNINRMRFGWLTGKILHITQPSQNTYKLFPPIHFSKGNKAIRIPLKNTAGEFIGKSIWLESRKPTTSLFEVFPTDRQAYVTGISIRYVKDDLVDLATKPLIRDTTPTSTAGDEDAPLQVGQTYTDLTYGVIIEFLYRSETLGDIVRVTVTR